MPRSLRCATRSRMSLTAIGSMPASGSSSRMKFGCVASARAISTRRRSPPDSAMRRARAQMADRELRQERVEHRSRARSGSGSATSSTGADVLLDRETAEDRGFLRQIADAEPRAAVHRQIGDVVAVEFDGAGIGRYQAGDDVEAGGLAGAVRTRAARPLRRAAPTR